MVTRHGLVRAVTALSLALSVAPAFAQVDQEQSFSLSSSHVFSTREKPAFMLAFRRVSYLDFRVYRVRDPLDFFARLRDPHVLGSPQPVVPQERTFLERLADWKADTRDRIRAFVRAQFSYRYRAARRATLEKQQVQLRRTLRYHAFTQAPLLNPSLLVSSWREMLPLGRDTDARSIPLDLREPGVYVVEAVNPPLKAYTIVVITDLGIVTKSAPGQVLVYVANRFSGEPVAGCDVRTIVNQKSVTSGVTTSEGTIETAIAATNPDSVVAIARCGSSAAVVDAGAWFLHGNARELTAYLYTDRPVYRPGHTVNIRGVLRWRVAGGLQPFDSGQAEVSVSDPGDKVLFRQKLLVDQFGSVHASFVVPPGGALGYYSMRLTVDDQTAHAGFDVQEYRKPEFDVDVRAAQQFAVQGAEATFSVAARYYFGQPVAGGVVKYVVRRAPYYSPLRYDEDSEQAERGWYGGLEQAEQTTRLGPDGTATIRVPLPPDKAKEDYSVNIEARVTDPSGREVSGQAGMHATWSTFLLGVRSSQYVVQPGAPTHVEIRASDYTGQPQPGLRVHVWVERVEYGQPEPSTEQVSQSEVTTDADGHAGWDVTFPAVAGSYRIRALAVAPDGREVQGSGYAWIPGPMREQETVVQMELVPDKKSYQPGDTARLMLRGADIEAPILVTKEAHAVTYHSVVRHKPTDTIDVAVVADDEGDTYVSVAFLKNDRVYRAEKRLRVPPTARQLHVTITPEAAVSRPGQPGRFTFAVRDASGNPVRAQLSVGVVDEALYGVKPDRTPDPVRFFYQREYSRVGTEFSHSYSFVGFSGTSRLLLAQRRRPLTLADFKADRPERPQVRKNFPDAIFWNPAVVTDASGTAHVELPYPDSLTTWRLTVRAFTADTLAGAAIGRTITTKDLITRVIAPRFLTEGDETAIPIVVHNYLPGQKEVTVETTVAGLTPVAEAPAGRQRLSIAPGGEQRLDPRFKAEVVGRAVVTANATTDGAADAMQTSLPVLPFGLERFSSVSGSIVKAPEAAAAVTIPERSNPAARTLRISLAPSMAGALLGALDFLTSYPYGCTEQTLSSFVPNLVVLRALAQLKLAPAERLSALDRQVTEGLRRLYDYQHEDGGWGWWKTDENDPFMTAYALDGLIEAKLAGYAVDEGRIGQARSALEALYLRYPRATPDLKVYETYVLERSRHAGRRRLGSFSQTAEKDALDELWNARSRMSNYGRALLLLALQTAGDERRRGVETELLSSVQAKGDVAWWPVESDPLLYEPVDATVEATALAVRGLVVDHATDPVLERAVRYLLANRNGGYYWSSTKQTAIVLYGLLDYLRARHEQPAPFAVDVFVNDALVGTRAFTEADLAAPDPAIVSAPGVVGENRVRLVKRGAGTLYWSVQAQYYQVGGRLEATGSRKLAISRLYYQLVPVQKQDRVVYREVPFTGSANPGDVLLVRLTVAGATDWRHLMIDDPLPAGAEAIRQQWLYELDRPARWAPASREYRDNRVVFFQQDFSEGRYEYVYLLKVVTPGTFKAMPARIMPMYVPGVFASTEQQGVRFGALPR